MYKLSEKVEKTSRETSALDVHAKNVVDYIIRLYEQLQLKLEGSKEGKYTKEQLILAQENLHLEVDSVLTDLMQEIHFVLRGTEDAKSLTNIIGGLITKEYGLIRSQSDVLQISESGLGGALRSTFSWDGLSKLQRMQLDRDLDLTTASINAIHDTRIRLLQLAGFLERFREAAKYGKIANSRMIIMGLDAEHLLTLYRENLVKTRQTIDGWK